MQNKLSKKTLYIEGSAVGKDQAQDPLRKQLGRQWVNKFLNTVSQIEEDTVTGESKKTFATKEYVYLVENATPNADDSQSPGKLVTDVGLLAKPDYININLPLLNAGTTYGISTPLNILYNTVAYHRSDYRIEKNGTFAFNNIWTRERFYLAVNPEYYKTKGIGYVRSGLAVQMQDLGLQWSQGAAYGEFTGVVPQGAQPSEVAWFYDCTFEMETPLVNDEADDAPESTKFLLAEINPRYHYFHQSYEEVLNNLNPHESELPNPYDIEYTDFAIKIDPLNSLADTYLNFVTPTLLDLYGNNYQSFSTLNLRIPSEVITTKDSFMYFKLWSHCYSSLNQSEKSLLGDPNKVRYIEQVYDPIGYPGTDAIGRALFDYFEFSRDDVQSQFSEAGATPTDYFKQDIPNWFPMSVEIKFEPNLFFFRNPVQVTSMIAEGKQAIFAEGLMAKIQASKKVQTINLSTALPIMRWIVENIDGAETEFPLWGKVVKTLPKGNAYFPYPSVDANFVRQREVWHHGADTAAVHGTFSRLTDNVYIPTTFMGGPTGEWGSVGLTSGLIQFRSISMVYNGSIIDSILNKDWLYSPQAAPNTKQFFNTGDYEQYNEASFTSAEFIQKYHEVIKNYWDTHAAFYRRYKDILEKTNRQIHGLMSGGEDCEAVPMYGDGGAIIEGGTDWDCEETPPYWKFTNAAQQKPEYYSHKEMLFFEIVKSKIGAATHEIVQKFILCPPLALGMQAKDFGDKFTRYIDTQVKYGQEYSYEIFAYVLVYGTKYRCLGVKEYESIEALKEKIELETIQGVGPGGDIMKHIDYGPGATSFSSQLEEQSNSTIFYRFEIESRPYWKVVRVPYAGVNWEEKGSIKNPVRVCDSPPIYPNIEVVPFKGKNDEILINFQDGLGKLLEVPVSILSDETYSQFKEYKQGEKVLFRSDDIAAKFRIYRVDKEPYTYKDFASSDAKVIDINRLVHGASYKDTLVPNKKYYYTFKSIDVHEQFSNPSPMVTVELRDEDGAFYPIIEEFMFKPKSFKKRVKKGRKLIYIAPAKRNLIVNNLQQMAQNPEQNIQPMLGDGGPTVYGKKYKIRLTSEQSNKMIDFVVEFPRRHNNKKGIEPLTCGPVDKEIWFNSPIKFEGLGESEMIGNGGYAPIPPGFDYTSSEETGYTTDIGGPTGPTGDPTGDPGGATPGTPPPPDNTLGEYDHPKKTDASTPDPPSGIPGGGYGTI